jgi:Zn-dependent peptidase ImmA (M78 family)
MRLNSDGLAFWLDGRAFVYINSLLPYSERVITGFHELAHILYHPTDNQILHRRALWNWSKCDRQGQYEVRRESAEFRASLDLWRVTD